MPPVAVAWFAISALTPIATVPALRPRTSISEVLPTVTVSPVSSTVPPFVFKLSALATILPLLMVVPALPLLILTRPPLPGAFLAVSLPLFCTTPPSALRIMRPLRCAMPVARMTPVLFTASAYTLPPAAFSSVCAALMLPEFFTPVPPPALPDLTTTRSSPAAWRRISFPAASAATPLGALILPSFSTLRAMRTTSPSRAVMTPRLTVPARELPLKRISPPAMNCASGTSSVEARNAAVSMRPVGPTRTPLGFTR